jgi:hypothetical protein
MPDLRKQVDDAAAAVLEAKKDLANDVKRGRS